ncbi:MAG TPA: hypothetical protein PKC97_00255 [Burkholderiaceae bacterium]|nr:hypothetical protein [Burkholderiaceae bacterium]
MKLRNLFVLAAAAAISSSVLAQAAPPQAVAIAASAPGEAVLASKVTLTATVVAIDSATRTVTLKGGSGNIVDVVVPPEAKKLDEIKVGDLVTVEYARAVSLTLKKKGDGIRSSTSQSATAGAPAGAVAGGAAAHQVTILANVTAVNKKEHYVTLRGPKGNSVDLAVQDPEQLKLVKVGDQVEVVYTVAMAITVDAAAKPAKK